MSKGGGDGLEVIGYFIFFWAFIFSPKFRQSQIQEWKESGVVGKIFIIIEACSSILCGVCLPVYILYLIFIE
jgi:hypothetical protein